jgi:hypothetical protein
LRTLKNRFGVSGAKSVSDGSRVRHPSREICFQRYWDWCGRRQPELARLIQQELHGDWPLRLQPGASLKRDPAADQIATQFLVGDEQFGRERIRLVLHRVGWDTMQ